MTDQAATPVAETAVPVTPPTSIVSAPEPAPAAEATPAAPVRPEGLPDAYWDDAAGIKPEAYAKLAELEAAAADRPASPVDYKLELPEPVLGPNGQPVQFDANDPLAQAVLPALHEAGVSQAGLSKILAAFAHVEVEGAKAQAQFIAAEQAKLGAEHAKRTGAVFQTVSAKIGAEKAQALMNVLGTADAFVALEALTQGLTGPAISAAPPSDPGAAFEGLTGADALAAIRARKAA